MKTGVQRRELLLAAALGLLPAAAAAAAEADAVAALRSFVREVHSGRAEFTQTVVSADGRRSRSSSGQFEFVRPDRFRFAYQRPFEQLIVADGRRIWIHDPDLQQVTVRPQTQALGATPAALLTGTDIERDFDLAALPAREGLAWVQARPKQRYAGFELLRVGFAGRELAAIEIVDGFGQTTLLRFARFEAGIALPPATFRFTPPPGTALLEP